MKILVVLDHYLPGYRAGGPPRTIAGLIERFGGQHDFWLLTRDRDFGEDQPYDNVAIDRWTTLGNVRIFYGSPAKLSPRQIGEIARQAAPDAVYLNSFFSSLTFHLLLWRRLGLLPGPAIVLAPRGEFAPDALALGRLKKRLYIRVSRALGFFRNVLWQASSVAERGQIERVIGPCAVHVASDLPPRLVTSELAKPPKQRGEARFIFLSRITAMKNLPFALVQLQHVRGKARFEIFGPIDEPDCWARCQTLLRDMPPNVEASYGGPLAPSQTTAALGRAHFFVLPTLGENFGHAILEAMANGSPAIISDRTPWRGLAECGAGWDVPLEQPARWKELLQVCVDMDQQSYDRLSRSAREFAAGWERDESVQEQTRELFERMKQLSPCAA